MKKKYTMPQTTNLKPKDNVVYSYVEKIISSLNDVYNIKPECDTKLDEVYNVLVNVLQAQTLEDQKTLLHDVMHNLKVLNCDEILTRSAYKISMLAHRKNLIVKYVNNQKIKLQDKLLLSVQNAIKIDQTLLETLDYMHGTQYDV